MAHKIQYLKNNFTEICTIEKLHNYNREVS